MLSLQTGQRRPERRPAPQVQPVARLDVELWRGGERLGLLARLRDLLPGRVAIGLTGRDPDGRTCSTRAATAIRLSRFRRATGPPTSRTIAFTIK